MDNSRDLFGSLRPNLNAQDKQSSFTPQGMTRNQFSGMLSSVEHDHIPPLGRSRPLSASVSRMNTSGNNGQHHSRPASASNHISIGNKLYNSVREAHRPVDDDDDDDERNDNALVMGVSDDINDMIINRKDRDRGINGVGGLLEQQIRKLQLSQPIESEQNGLESAMDRDNTWKTDKTAPKKIKKTQNSKGFVPLKSGVNKHRQVEGVYSNPVIQPAITSSPSLKKDLQFRTTNQQGGGNSQSANSGAGLTINILKRAKSAGTIRSSSTGTSLKMSQTNYHATNGPPMNGNGIFGSKQQQVITSKIQPTHENFAKTEYGRRRGSDRNSANQILPAVTQSSNDLLQNKIHKLSLNPALLF